MKNLLQKAWRDPVSRNALALMGLTSTRYLFLLAIIPYISRVLQPAEFGVFMIYQSLAYSLWLLLDYGFEFSATRETARWQGHRTQQARIAADVLGARLIVILVAVLATVAAAVFVPMLREHPHYLLWSWLWALGLALQPMWFFRGIEEVLAPAAVEVTLRLAAVVGVFLLVHRPEDGWRVPALFAISSLAISLANLAAMYRRIPFRIPALKASLAMLRTGWDMFVLRGAVGAYATATPFLMGLLVGKGNSEQVAFYGAAEKIVRALQSVIAAVGHAFYPRVSALVKHDLPRAARLTRINLALMAAISLLVAAVLTALAHPCIVVIFGGKYAPAAHLLALLAVLIPVISVSNVLAIHWMLPLGMDRLVTLLVIPAGLLNFALAVALVPKFQADGMAWSIVVAESAIVVGAYLMLRWRKMDPLFLRGEQP